MNPFDCYLDHVDERGCWITWLAPNDSGYGTIWIQPRRKVGLHVASYLHFIGHIPDGLVLDHAVCQNPLCFNPEHLEPVTAAENVRRATEKIRAAPFPCGHPRTAENTVSNGVNSSGNPSYRCKMCNTAKCSLAYPKHYIKRGKPDISGEAHPMARLTTDAVSEIRRLKTDGVTQREIARRYEVSTAQISRIVRGESWPFGRGS